MAPVAVLASLGQLGGSLPPTYVVGCEPADVGEGIGLTRSRGRRAAVDLAAVCDGAYTGLLAPRA